LSKEGADLHIYDPKVPHEEIKGMFPGVHVVKDTYEAAKDAHALVVLTEWDEFLKYDYNKIFSVMVKPAFVFDGRNILDVDRLNKIGFQCFAVGVRSAFEKM